MGSWIDEGTKLNVLEHTLCSVVRSLVGTWAASLDRTGTKAVRPWKTGEVAVLDQPLFTVHPLPCLVVVLVQDFPFFIFDCFGVRSSSSFPYKKPQLSTWNDYS